MTCEHVRDWRASLIRKVVTKRIEEKLQLWETEARDMKPLLPEDDRVWLSWSNQIQSFRMVMKWVSKLLDGVFTDDDFEELFAAVGRQYDPAANYTVQDLIDFKFDDYTDLINGIYRRGHLNVISKQQLAQVRELWSRKIKFKLAKNYPLKAFDAGVDEQRVFDEARFGSKKSESSRTRELGEQSRHLSDESAYMNANVSYKLVDVNEIRQAYDDAAIRLGNVLTSGVKARLKEEAQELLGRLDEAVYLTELWWQVIDQSLGFDCSYVFSAENFIIK